MRISPLLGLFASLALGACGSSTSTPGTGSPGADVGSSDIGLTFDVLKSDTGGATDQSDVGAGTDAAAPKDTAAPDVPVTPDVPAPPPDTGSDPDVAEPECPSGVKWLLLDLVGTDLMEPGLACIQCHTSKGKVAFTIAGTVYPGFHTVDTCDGTASITVEITGSDGKVQTLSTNSVGNFHGNSAVAMPFTARVIDGSGKDRKMFSAQSNGDCNTCHTQSGTNGAPGRIHAP